MLTYGGLQLAFPYRDAVPSHFRQTNLFVLVTLLVALNLACPELDVGSRKSEVFATLMTMPETTVHEDYRAVFAQHYVGMSRQAWMIEPVTEATTEQKLAHQHFRSGVLAAYCRHALMSLFFSQFVHDVVYSAAKLRKIIELYAW